MTDSSIYTIEIDPSVSSDKYYYALTMFPYPSGSKLHVGHASIFTIHDIAARYKRMSGYKVLNPFGFDSFWLPTENYAMKQWKPAYDVTKENGDAFLDQIASLNLSFDQSRIIYTSDPEYYKWTQWIFCKLFEKGLVYRDELWVNRCPECQTVLANDQVVDGKCERCSSEITQKKMPQWFIKITAYADRLIKDLDLVDRPEETKIAQKNWIWRSEGMLFSAKVKDMDLQIQTFSAHFEACYADTFVAIAPEHDLIKKLVEGQDNEKEVLEFCDYILAQRVAAGYEWYKEIEGIFTWRYIEDPLWNGLLPIWVASFALASYWTGIVKCSAHDERDFWFAKKYNIPLKTVLISEDKEMTEKILSQEICFTDMQDGYLTEPKEFLGKKWSEIREMMKTYLEDKWYATRKVNYKLRDRSVSRQRYRWSPIPIYYDIKENPKVPFMKYTTWPKGFREGEPTLIRPVIQCIVKDKNSDQYCFLQHTHDNDYSGFFGGLEWNESPVEAWYRELKEEAGFENAEFIKEITYYQLQFYHPTKNRNQYSLNTSLYFEVDRTTQKEITEEEKSKHTTVWMTADEFFAKTKNETTVFAMNALLWTQHDAGKREETEKYNEFNPVPAELMIPKLVPEDQLPVVLPLDVQNYKPVGKSPLEEHPTFKYYSQNDKVYLRECDTLDTFMCSSFYFLRFVDAHNPDALVRKEWADKLLPVDFYSGGKEHTVGHLLYSRFIHKFLHDEGYVPWPEPFMKLVHQWMVLAHDGRKMWKRYGNTIDPQDVIAKYSADSLRTYLMFMGPVESEKNRNDNALQGVHRFLERVKKLPDMLSDEKNTEIEAALHKTIKWVSQDLERYKFNTVISKLMILVNKIYEVQSLTRDQLHILSQLLAPFATELAEELRQLTWGNDSVHLSLRPKRDEAKIVETSIVLPVQINGKKRFDVDITPGMSQEDVIQYLKTTPEYQKYVGDAAVKKVIFVQDKIINFIV